MMGAKLRRKAERNELLGEKSGEKMLNIEWQ